MQDLAHAGREAAIAAALRVVRRGGYCRPSSRAASRTAPKASAPMPAATLHRLPRATRSAPALAAPRVSPSRIVDNPAGGGAVPDRGAHRAIRRFPPCSPTATATSSSATTRSGATACRRGRSPSEGDRWYGRGTADNKGQHTINLAALARVLDARGRLGFNVKVLLEMGEETGSPGLRDGVRARARGASRRRADRLRRPAAATPTRPTLFLGSRGAFNFDLTVDLRAGGHHSGNWGGLLANPGVDPRATRSRRSSMRAAASWSTALRPPPIPAIRCARALADIVPGEPGGPAIDTDWGEPGLTPAERVFAWNTLEVLAFVTGNPEHPVNAIPPRASAHMQMRFVVGCDPATFVARIARAPRCARLRRRRGDAGDGRDHACDAARPRASMGAPRRGRRSRATTGRAARDPAEPRRIAAERLLRRGAGPADGVGSAFVSGVLAARAERAPAALGGARRPRDHDRAFSGIWAPTRRRPCPILPRR